jgi:NADPH2:quinone reductase
MRAVVYKGAGGPEVIVVEERPEPVAGPGEILVEVRVGGLNPADIAQRQGSYPPPPGVSEDIPGMEVSGTVRALGEGADRFRVGDRVFGLVGGGGLADLVVVPEAHVAPIPANLDEVQAAAIPEAFLTAHDALVTQGGLVAGETVLVQGASGGVGSAAVQIARILGARAIGSVRSDEAEALVRSLGAEVVRSDGYVEAVRALTDGVGVDLVVEMVGGPNVVADLDAIRVGGRIVVVGTGAGAEIERFPLGKLMGRRATIRGTVLRARPHDQKAAVIAGFERDVLPAIASGEVRAVVDEVFDVERAREAYARLEGSGKRGKILLRFG